MRMCSRLEDEIGWNLTMCGLVNENWSAQQEAFFELRTNRQLDQTGKVWSTKIFEWFILEARKQWLEWNKEVHESDNGQSKIEQDTIEQVRNLYSLRDDISQHDRAIFDEALEERLQQNILTLQQWVRNTMPIVNRYIRDFVRKS